MERFFNGKCGQQITFGKELFVDGTRAIQMDIAGRRFNVLVDGRIQSLNGRNGLPKFLTCRDISGYGVVRVGTAYYKAHRLVAMAFIPNPSNKPQINHKNGEKFDNRIENLEWCTIRENSHHARDVIKTFNPRAKEDTGTGVSYHKKSGRYTATIFINGKTKHIGLYATRDEATAARLIALSLKKEGRLA